MMREGFIERVKAAASADSRIVGLTLGGSAVGGAMDEFSDLDFVVVCEEGSREPLLAEAQEFARSLGPLLAAFTGEHVGEPRLLIALYGPPLLHVDLKFVSLGDLARRVENGLVIWERDGAVSRVFRESESVWPQPDLQWIEDRFWIWVHYSALKIGRGELFECLDALSYLRAAVFGPLLAVSHGRRPQGVRRIESYAPDAVPALEATIGAHSAAGCSEALRAAVALYRRLREELDDGALVRRSEAEAATLAYVDDIAARVERR